LQFLSLLLSTVIANRQSKLLHYVLAENRVLRARLGASELRFNDAERMALGRAGKAIGRKLLAEIATLAHPETILRWYRRLVAKKYTGER
ncbi:hypothetical protein, partial [Pseudomonas sp. MPR-AND1A]|uniref:hypothetical protein n=1 Tax=Pseudomonas sp. MPR-AND1A TaxID=2070600 RepID=UPI000CC1FF7D